MKHHAIAGGNSVKLHVVETGNPDGPPIVFVHGWSQSHIVWQRQLLAPGLAQRFRLVALDLRGHGDSEKPLDAYGDSRAWADDLAALVTALRLPRAVFCVWSYGGYVVSDYLRHHGQSHTAGLVYAGAATDLGVATEYAFLGAGWQGILPAAYGESSEEAAGVMRAFLRNCFATKLAFDVELALLESALLTPPRVRRALFSRRLQNDDVLAALAVPALVAHGEADAIVDVATGRHTARLVPHARLSIYPACGHAPFWEDAERFNRELAQFVVEAARTV